MRGVENFINIDVSSMLSAGFLDQTAVYEGKRTLSSIYINFYVDLIVKNARSNGIIYSPNRRMFVSRLSTDKLKAEDYTTVTELRTLSSILGRALGWF